MPEDGNIGCMSQSDVETLQIQLRGMEQSLRTGRTLLSWIMGLLSAIVMTFGGIFWQKQSDQHDALIKLIQQVADLPKGDEGEIKSQVTVNTDRIITLQKQVSDENERQTMQENILAQVQHRIDELESRRP
jgi:hypothetical protein